MCVFACSVALLAYYTSDLTYLVWPRDVAIVSLNFQALALLCLHVPYAPGTGPTLPSCTICSRHWPYFAFMYHAPGTGPTLPSCTMLQALALLCLHVPCSRHWPYFAFMYHAPGTGPTLPSCTICSKHWPYFAFMYHAPGTGPTLPSCTMLQALALLCLHVPCSRHWPYFAFMYHAPGTGPTLPSCTICSRHWPYFAFMYHMLQAQRPQLLLLAAFLGLS